MTVVLYFQRWRFWYACQRIGRASERDIVPFALCASDFHGLRGGTGGCRRVLYSAAARLIFMRAGRKDERSIYRFYFERCPFSSHGLGRGRGKEGPAILYSQRLRVLYGC